MLDIDKSFKYEYSSLNFNSSSAFDVAINVAIFVAME